MYGAFEAVEGMGVSTGHTDGERLVVVVFVLRPFGTHAVSRDLAFASLPQPPPSRPLVFGKLVHDAVRKFALWGVITVVVEGLESATVLLELAPEQEVIGGFTGEAVPVSGEHRPDTATRSLTLSRLTLSIPTASKDTTFGG